MQRQKQKSVASWPTACLLSNSYTTYCTSRRICTIFTKVPRNHVFASCTYLSAIADDCTILGPNGAKYIPIFGQNYLAPTEFTDATNSGAGESVVGTVTTADVNAPTVAELLATEVSSKVAATCGRSRAGRRKSGSVARTSRGGTATYPPSTAVRDCGRIRCRDHGDGSCRDPVWRCPMPRPRPY